MQLLESTDSAADVAQLTAHWHAMARDCTVRWLHFKIKIVNHVDKYLTADACSE